MKKRDSPIAKNKKLDPAEFEEKVLAKEKNLKRGWERKLENQSMIY